MLRYEFLAALEAICKEQSFERAAKTLHITQSAISQRIRALEEEIGQRVLHRGPPIEPTRAGQALLGHVQQVALLEKELGDKLALDAPGRSTRIAIGINADSFSTWFVSAIETFLKAEGILVDIVLDDESYTHELLERGVVVGCLSAMGEAFAGCERTYLGAMRYRCMCTKQFKAKYLPRGLTKEAIETAPTVLFNRKDSMHERFLRTVLGSSPPPFNAHYAPSTEQFGEFVARGLAYGLIPDLQRQRREKLVNLTPSHHYDVKLYWHRPRLRSSFLERMDNAVITGAKAVLEAVF